MNIYITKVTVMSASKKILKLRQKRKSTKSKTSAESNIRPLAMIHEKIKQFSNDNPDAEEFCINSEAEAGELLIYMSAAVTTLAYQKAEQGDNRFMIKALRHQAGVFKGHFRNLTALKFIGGEDLSIHGLKLVVSDENEA